MRNTFVLSGLMWRPGGSQRVVYDQDTFRATVLLSAPRDVDALVKHIVHPAEDRELRIRLAGARQARIAEFTWQRSIGPLETCLEQLVQSRRGR